MSELSENTKNRLNALSENAANKLLEAKVSHRSREWLQHNVVVPNAPIFIASTEDIGTRRARANHLDAAISYCEEQERLKVRNQPL